MSGSFRYRFASDPMWPYWVMNMKDRHSINTQVSIGCRDMNLLEKFKNDPEKLMEEDSESIKGDETESMRHAIRLEQRAQKALEEEKQREQQQAANRS